MIGKRIHIIFNPASAGGRTHERQSRILDEIEKYFGKDYSLWITKKPLDAGVFSGYAVKSGCELLIVVGGDGTIQEAVNGMMSSESFNLNSCVLGIISSGTGQGFAQSLSLPSTIEEQIKIIGEGYSKSIDLGCVSFFKNNKIHSRYFVNEFQAGIGGAVCAGVSQRQKRTGGKIAFGLGTISTALKYPNQKLILTVDGRTEITNQFTGIVVGNGKFTGGGMKLTPLSDLNDGYLDLLLINKQTRLQRLISFSKIYSGRHVNSKFFDYRFIREVKIESDEDVPLEADGEILGSLPCKVEVVQSAISVLVPKYEGEKNEKFYEEFSEAGI